MTEEVPSALSASRRARACGVPSMTQSGLIGFGANSTSAGAAKETAGTDIIGSSNCVPIVNIESANRHCERGEAIRRLDCLAAVASRNDDMIREIVIYLSQAETRCSRVAGDRRWLFCSFRNATQLR
jgi:hypothetical protein